MPVLFRSNLLIGCLLVTCLSCFASDWEKLEDCKFVSEPYNDGDSFKVEHNGKFYHFRLYFVDTPERGLFYPDRVSDQAEYFGISSTQATKLGGKASLFTRRFLNSQFDVYTQWQKGGGTHVRYTAVIYASGKSLIEELVSNGLARIHGFKPGSAWPGGLSSKSYVRKLKSLEKKAHADEKGGWRYSNLSIHNDADWDRRNKDDLDSLGLVDLNKSSVEELVELPGIGPVLAQRIIDGRPYGTVDDVLSVKGVGEKTLANMRDYLTTGFASKKTQPFEIQGKKIPRKTAQYYLQDPLEWNGREIELSISGLEVLDETPPDGFVVFNAATRFLGTKGGSIKLYLLAELKDEAQQYFQKTDQELIIRVRFFHYNRDWIVVYRGTK